jgi:hypothetical protein
MSRHHLLPWTVAVLLLGCSKTENRATDSTMPAQRPQDTSSQTPMNNPVGQYDQNNARSGGTEMDTGRTADSLRDTMRNR